MWEPAQDIWGKSIHSLSKFAKEQAQGNLWSNLKHNPRVPPGSEPRWNENIGWDNEKQKKFLIACVVKKNGELLG